MYDLKFPEIILKINYNTWSVFYILLYLRISRIKSKNNINIQKHQKGFQINIVIKMQLKHIYTNRDKHIKYISANAFKSKS